MRGRRAMCVALALAGCGQRGEHPAAGPAPAAVYEADPAGREVVATVDGDPVYADCVARQAAGLDLPADAARARALDDCIGFELVAREARRRGLDRDADARDAEVREAVRLLVEREFLPHHRSSADLPDEDLAHFWPKIKPHFNHPELRSIVYCRVALPKKEPRGTADDQAAAAFADEIHAALLLAAPTSASEMADVCKATAGTRTLSIETRPYRFWHQGPTNKAIDDAVFALPAAGAITDPIRSPWGWDVLLLLAIEPPEAKTLAEAAPIMREELWTRPEFEAYRESIFTRWAKPFDAGLTIEVHPERIPADELAGLDGPAAPAPPAPGAGPR